MTLTFIFDVAAKPAQKLLLKGSEKPGDTEICSTQSREAMHVRTWLYDSS